jgi:hypothetical protein
MPDLTTEEKLAAAESEVSKLTADKARLEGDLARVQAKHAEDEERIFRKKFDEKWEAFLNDEVGRFVLAGRMFLFYADEGTFLMVLTHVQIVRIQITDQNLIAKLKAITTEPDVEPSESKRTFWIWPEG